MDTAQFDQGSIHRGCGRIDLIFGDFSQNVAHFLLDDNSLLHLHGRSEIEQVIRAFGSLQNARGSRIQFTTNALGVLLDLQAA